MMCARLLMIKSPSWLGTTRSAEARLKYLFIFINRISVETMKCHRTTHVGRCNSVAVPWYTKHSIAAGLNDEFTKALFDDVRGEDKFDSTVSTTSAGDT